MGTECSNNTRTQLCTIASGHPITSRTKFKNIYIMMKTWIIERKVQYQTSLVAISKCFIFYVCGVHVIVLFSATCSLIGYCGCHDFMNALTDSEIEIKGVFMAICHCLCSQILV